MTQKTPVDLNKASDTSLKSASQTRKRSGYITLFVLLNAAFIAVLSFIALRHIDSTTFDFEQRSFNHTEFAQPMPNMAETNLSFVHELHDYMTQPHEIVCTNALPGECELFTQALERHGFLLAQDQPPKYWVIFHRFSEGWFEVRFAGDADHANPKNHIAGPVDGGPNSTEPNPIDADTAYMLGEDAKIMFHQYQELKNQP